jgi:hypothetical protein
MRAHAALYLRRAGNAGAATEKARRAGGKRRACSAVDAGVVEAGAVEAGVVEAGTVEAGAAAG